MKFVVEMDCNQMRQSVYVVDASTEDEAFEKALADFVAKDPTKTIDSDVSVTRFGFCYSIKEYPSSKNGVVEVNGGRDKTVFPNNQNEPVVFDNKVHPTISKIVAKYRQHPKIIEEKRIRKHSYFAG